MSSTEDLYATLSLPQTASEVDIKRAYRKLALKYHPDKNKEKDAEDKFKSITRSYEILSDPAKKAQYDLTLNPKPSFKNSNSSYFTTTSDSGYPYSFYSAQQQYAKPTNNFHYSYYTTDGDSYEADMNSGYGRYHHQFTQSKNNHGQANNFTNSHSSAGARRAWNTWTSFFSEQEDDFGDVFNSQKTKSNSKSNKSKQKQKSTSQQTSGNYNTYDSAYNRPKSTQKNSYSNTRQEPMEQNEEKESSTSKASTQTMESPQPNFYSTHDKTWSKSTSSYSYKSSEKTYTGAIPKSKPDNDDTQPQKRESNTESQAASSSVDPEQREYFKNEGNQSSNDDPSQSSRESFDSSTASSPASPRLHKFNPAADIEDVDHGFHSDDPIVIDGTEDDPIIIEEAENTANGINIPTPPPDNNISDRSDDEDWKHSASQTFGGLKFGESSPKFRESRIKKPRSTRSARFRMWNNPSVNPSPGKSDTAADEDPSRESQEKGQSTKAFTRHTRSEIEEEHLNDVDYSFDLPSGSSGDEFQDVNAKEVPTSNIPESVGKNMESQKFSKRARVEKFFEHSDVLNQDYTNPKRTKLDSPGLGPDGQYFQEEGDEKEKEKNNTSFTMENLNNIPPFTQTTGNFDMDSFGESLNDVDAGNGHKWGKESMVVDEDESKDNQYTPEPTGNEIPIHQPVNNSTFGKKKRKLGVTITLTDLQCDDYTIASIAAPVAPNGNFSIPELRKRYRQYQEQVCLFNSKVFDYFNKRTIANLQFMKLITSNEEDHLVYLESLKRDYTIRKLFNTVSSENMNLGNQYQGHFAPSA